MRIIRITLLKLQALKLSELGWKYFQKLLGMTMTKV